MKDAEANDMIHMGSDHRCVMATVLINTPEKNTHDRRKKNMRRLCEVSELEERYQEIVETIKKKPPPKKKMMYMTQEITRKIKSKKRTPQQQQKQKAHLLKL